MRWFAGLGRGVEPRRAGVRRRRRRRRGSSSDRARWGCSRRSPQPRGAGQRPPFRRARPRARRATRRPPALPAPARRARWQRPARDRRDGTGAAARGRRRPRLPRALQVVVRRRRRPCAVALTRRLRRPRPPVRRELRATAHAQRDEHPGTGQRPGELAALHGGGVRASRRGRCPARRFLLVPARRFLRLGQPARSRRRWPAGRGRPSSPPTGPSPP